MVSEFVREYKCVCTERGVEFNDNLLQALQRPCSSPGVNGKAILNLRTNSLDEQTCSILGKMLSVDRLFEKIDLSDCALSLPAMSHILCGLNTNTVCTQLNLKGNNVRGQAVECLARMLCQNKAIECLVLEWNNVGMLDDPFMMFCEGLGNNTSLIQLDLRNNQISHHGAAEIANALKRNTTLRKLDLRWNNIGLVGGKALIEAFKLNRTLDKIELNGNDMPDELKKSIENAARNNEEIHKLSTEYKSRTQTLAGELNRVKKTCADQCDDLLSRLEEKDERLKKTNRFATQKVEHFQELLDERKSAFNSLTSKLTRVESEMVLAEQKAKDFEILLGKERADKEAISASYRAKLQEAKQLHTSLESKLSAELADITEKHNDCMIEVIELRKTSCNQNKQINELKEEIASLQADSRAAASTHQERVKKEQLKHSQAIRELNLQKEKEVEQVLNDQSLIEASLRKHIAKVEEQKRDAEEEISKLKALLITERIKAEEELSQTRQKLKSDMDFHIHHMEDKLKLLHSAKDDVQQVNSQQACTISELQTKNNSLTMGVDNLKRQIESLQQGIAAKYQDIDNAKQEVRTQMSEKLRDSEKEMSGLKSERDKLLGSKHKLEDRVSQLENDVDKKNEQLKHLKEKLSMRESDIAWMREETAQRAKALQVAVKNYAQPLTTQSA